MNLVNFIIKVYAPIWFEIRKNQSFEMGPEIIFKYIKLVRENMPPQISRIIYNVIDRNSYFGHAENVLVTMLADSDPTIRQKAVSSILKAREKSPNVERAFRKFKKPKLKFDAPTYHEMVDIDSTEPPLTRRMSNDILKTCIDTEENCVKMAMNGIPNYTQAVERFVQLVSQTAGKVVGSDQRNRRICTTIASRAILPNTNSKKDYVDYLKK